MLELHHRQRAIYDLENVYEATLSPRTFQRMMMNLHTLKAHSPQQARTYQVLSQGGFGQTGFPYWRSLS